MKRVKITKTELVGMPGHAWSKLVAFLSRSNGEFTPLQKTFSLCVQYYNDAPEFGHLEFFEQHPDIEVLELVQALKDINTTSIATNLERAAAQASEGICDAEDMWLEENDDILFDALYTILLENQDEFYENVPEDYTLTLPRGLAWFGVIEAIVMYAMAVIFSFTEPENAPLIVGTFTVISFPGLFLILYVFFWKLTVKGEVITLQRPFMPRRSIQIEDISRIKDQRDGFLIYVQGRRCAHIESIASNYSFLRAQLGVAGKFPDLSMTHFTMKLPISSMLIAGFNVFFALCGLLWSLFYRPEPTVIQRALYGEPDYSEYFIVHLFFAAWLIAAAWFLIYRIKWRVEVSPYSLKIINHWVREVEYPIAQITKVVIDSQNMVVFVDKKKVVRIPVISDRYDALVQVLLGAKVPFYQNGQSTPSANNTPFVVVNATKYK